MDQIHLSPLVDQIQLTLGHISNRCCGHSRDVTVGVVPSCRDVAGDGVMANTRSREGRQREMVNCLMHVHTSGEFSRLLFF
jgi:hypothetical protein